MPGLLSPAGITCCPGFPGEYRYYLIESEDTISLYPTVPKKKCGNNNGNVHLLTEGRL
jgi:hypothetical protein